MLLKNSTSRPIAFNVLSSRSFCATSMESFTKMPVTMFNKAKIMRASYRRKTAARVGATSRKTISNSHQLMPPEIDMPRVSSAMGSEEKCFVKTSTGISSWVPLARYTADAWRKTTAKRYMKATSSAMAQMSEITDSKMARSIRRNLLVPRTRPTTSMVRIIRIKRRSRTNPVSNLTPGMAVSVALVTTTTTSKIFHFHPRANQKCDFNAKIRMSSSTEKATSKNTSIAVKTSGFQGIIELSLVNEKSATFIS
mmetsp:Transcript_8544/g.23764  ORF Transcript_8544/g.23764 Transcript_8544/m.23764 type:complete len:253 (-) Transcript_8544:436-1194(-)